MRMILVAALALASVAPAADRVDDYVRSQLAARNLPGVSIAVVQHGRIVKAAGYGVASLELEAPASPQTVYEIGSISTSSPRTPSCCSSKSAWREYTAREFVALLAAQPLKFAPGEL